VSKRKSLTTQVGGSHYVNMTVQPLEVIESFGPEENIGFLKGNVVKYLLRAGHKDEMLQDLLKAQDYMNRLIEFVGLLPKPNSRKRAAKR